MITVNYGNFYRKRFYLFAFTNFHLEIIWLSVIKNFASSHFQKLLLTKSHLVFYPQVQEKNKLQTGKEENVKLLQTLARAGGKVLLSTVKWLIWACKLPTGQTHPELLS
jgi:hypothetical protein